MNFIKSPKSGPAKTGPAGLAPMPMQRCSCIALIYTKDDIVNEAFKATSTVYLLLSMSLPGALGYCHTATLKERTQVWREDGSQGPTLTFTWRLTSAPAICRNSKKAMDLACYVCSFDGTMDTVCACWPTRDSRVGLTQICPIDGKVKHGVENYINQRHVGNDIIVNVIPNVVNCTVIYINQRQVGRSLWPVSNTKPTPVLIAQERIRVISIKVGWVWLATPQFCM